jgi:hypothetical protein
LAAMPRDGGGLLRSFRSAAGWLQTFVRAVK